MRQLTRQATIEELRSRLLEHIDDEHSMCDVAARTGIFCGGFAQWSFQELKARYPTIVRSRPRITPAELKDLANRWQIARQTVNDESLACDVQMHEGKLSTCKGWDEFSNADLERFHVELCGDPIEVTSEAAPQT